VPRVSRPSRSDRLADSSALREALGAVPESAQSAHAMLAGDEDFALGIRGEAGGASQWLGWL